jgi:outer membrane protein assembly factor BamB
MKAKYPVLIMVLLIAAMLLTACAGGAYSTDASYPGVSVGDDVVYLASGGQLAAIRLADGVLDWNYPAEKAESGIFYYAAPVMAGTRLLAGDYKNTLHGIDPKTGLQQWTYDQGGRWTASPVVVGDVVVAPNVDKNVYGFDLNGTLLWKFKSTDVFWAQPATDGELVYVGGMDHTLYAINPSDGSLVWKTDMNGAMVYPAAVGDGVIYQTTIANQLIAVDAKTGEITWQFTTDDAVWMTPVLQEGVLYLGDVKGNVYAVDAATGIQSWKQSVGDEALYGTPALLENGVIYSSEAGNIILVDFNGVKQWNRTIDGSLYSGVVLAGDTLLVGVTKGKITLVAYDLNGNLKWSYPPAE